MVYINYRSIEKTGFLRGKVTQLFVKSLTGGKVRELTGVFLFVLLIW